MEDRGAARVDDEESEWVRAHRALSRLARQRARADAEEGQWLLAALRSAAHIHAGFGSFGEYVGHLFGYSARFTHDKLRVAEALEGLPVLARALESGALPWSALRELTRVATADTERDWLDVARGKSARQLEGLVAGVRPGDLPTSARSAEARRHVLRFDVSADTFAIFREAMSHLRRASDARLDDDASLLAMARAVLGGPRDEGRASYQIAISVCSECGRGAQPAAGETVAVAAEIVDMARCDAQQLGSVGVEVSATAGDLKADERGLDMDAAIPTAHFGRECAHVGRGARDERPPPDAEVSAAPRSPANDTVRDDGYQTIAHVGSGANAPSSQHCTNTPDASLAATAPNASLPANAPNVLHARRRAQTRTRTQQTIPPAVRRSVLHRDRHQCCVPGCRNATFLDLHHVRPRAEGGPNAAENLITLCGAHHRAAHRGELVIEGGPAQGLLFRHSDGSTYGQVADARALDIYSRVFSALHQLGFREREVRGVLDELRRNADPTSLSSERLLRAALERFAPPNRAR